MKKILKNFYDFGKATFGGFETPVVVHFERLFHTRSVSGSNGGIFLDVPAHRFKMP